MKICSFEGCERHVICRGYCTAHYQQAKAGKVLTPILKDCPDEYRLLKHVVKSDGCWGWTGHTHKGYGQLTIRGKTVRAHRLSYELWVGEVPAYMTVHHKCANRLCCNPEHLELATDRENVGEMFARRAYEARIAELEAEVSALKAKYE
jgi:hypothetical protein